MHQAILTHICPFEAMHQHPGHCGKYQCPHGHSYRMEIAPHGLIKDASGYSDDGVIVNFAELKEIVSTTVLDQFSEAGSRCANTQPSRLEVRITTYLQASDWYFPAP